MPVFAGLVFFILLNADCPDFILTCTVSRNTSRCLFGSTFSWLMFLYRPTLQADMHTDAPTHVHDSKNRFHKVSQINNESQILP